MRTAFLESASTERSKGVFLSRASPVQEQNAVGMQSVVPLGLSRMNAGLVGSHAVYPLASNVVRMPPDGKLDASGSPRTSSLPLNSATAKPPSVGTRNESCFSAVKPVIGWNQWVKCVAP